TAFIAPASMRSTPPVSAEYKAQNFQALSLRSGRVWKTVPTRVSPSAWSILSAEVSSTGMPARLASRAACTLEAMPPVPTLPPSPASTGLRSFQVRISEMEVASGSHWFLSYQPSASDSRYSASASVSCATKADRRSLSPKRISEVATVSFSLTMGTTPQCNSLSMVRLALRVRSRWPASEAVSRTWPTVRPWRAKDLDHSLAK